MSHYQEIGDVSTGAYGVTQVGSGNTLILGHDNRLNPEKCLSDLLVANPQDDLNSIRRMRKRVPGTCEWTTTDPTISSWLSGSGPSLLWLIGGPGMGKTISSTYLVETLEERKSTSHAGLAYFFCAGLEKRNTSQAILRGLLWQLLQQDRTLIKHVLPLYSTTSGRCFESAESLWDLLIRTANSSEAANVYLLIDALDGVLDDSRMHLLRCLEDWTASHDPEGPSELRILLTSRPFKDTSLVGKVLHIESRAIKDDLLEVIDFKVNTLAQKNRYPPALRQEVKSKLQGGSGGTFLWASLMVEVLERSSTAVARKLLNQMPKNLSALYTQILIRLDSTEKDLATFVLRTLTVAQQSMKPIELAASYAMSDYSGHDWGSEAECPEVLEKISEYLDIYTVCLPLVQYDKHTNGVSFLSLIHI